jgi:peptidyl-prolyl cis-trans isomerase SurA
MTTRTLSALIFSIILTYKSSASAMAFIQTSGQDDQLLTIGGKPVDKNELIYLISKGNSTEDASKGMSREEFEENLSLFVNYKLKVREAEELGLDKSVEFTREFASFQENLKAPFLIKNSLEEGELRKAYSRMQEVVRASHILFQFPPNASRDDSLIVLKMALKVKGEIEQNGDINALAEQYSDDPSAKINKGDLGYFTSLQMVQPFEDAAYSIQTGKVSDPVLTSFGYHLIQVKDRQPNPGQVRVSHILVRIDETSNTGEDLARRKIADIYTEIQKENTVWEDIVKTYSEDPASSENGGILPWFSVGSMIPEFEIAAFSLTEIGEVSPPIRTQYGYHILRLEDKKPLESFESMEENIRSRILRDSRSTMIQSQVMAIQKARYSFDENEIAVEALSASLNNLNGSAFIPALENANVTSQPLFTLQGKTYTSQDLANFVREEEIIPRSNSGIFDAWYEQFTASKLNQAEEADLLANNTEYQMLLKEYRDGILLFSLMNEEVWQKGILDSLGQVSFYTKNLKNYQWKSRVNAFIVKVLDPAQLEAARTQLNGQVLNEELVSKFEIDYKTNKPLAYQTESGLVEYAAHPVLSKADLNLSYQEIESEGIINVVLLGEKLPAGPKKFEETRGLVIRDYQDFLDNSLLEKVKSKYPVVINSQAKEEAFIALNQQ